MTTEGPTAHPAFRPRWLLAGVAVVWAWYCHHWPYMHTANEAMRLYFVQALVEQGRPELDAIVLRHGNVPVDRSEYAGHVYMDKAPGASLLVAPLYPVLRALDPSVSGRGVWRFGYLATLLASVLPLLLMLAWMARALTCHGASGRGVAVTVLALATASPLLVYATLFFGHALAAACCGVAFWLIAATPADSELSRRRAWGAGACLGWAGLTDTPVFVLSGMIAAYGLLRRLPPRGELAVSVAWRARWRVAWPLAAGVVLGVVAQLLYNTWTLGHPLRFTYQFKGDRALAAIMQTGALGFRPPQPDALWGLWVSARRGLLYHAPWLLFAAAGLVWTATDRQQTVARRRDAAAALLLTVLYSLFVSGFADWPAGDSAGARHLLPVVPLLGQGLAHAWDRPGVARWARPVVVASVLAGVLLHLPTVATFPYHFAKIERPLLELTVPLVLSGGWSPSVGRWLGMNDELSFAACALLVALLWWRALRTPQEPAAVASRVRLAPLAAGAVLTLWAVALVSTVPAEPARAVAVGRWKALVMLQAATFGQTPRSASPPPVRP